MLKKTDRKCATCKYHGTSNGASSGELFCNYLLITKKRRQSPADNCDKYEKGKPLRVSGDF